MGFEQALLHRYQKTETASIVTEQTSEQLIKQEQSSCLIKTILAASVGSLAYLRAFFPENCFSHLRYNGDPTETYSDFSKLGSPNPDIEAIGLTCGPKITRLKKGVNPTADTLLDWLDGIFQALEKGYLKALQIGVYLDYDDPNTMVETYTFSFSTMGGLDLQLSNDATRITLTDARKGAQQLTRRIVNITETLEPLPDRRWLTVRLHYNENTPQEYDPPGFKRTLNQDSALRIPEFDNEVTGRHNCGSFNTGFHGIVAKISNCSENATVRPGRRSASRFYHVDDDIETHKINHLTRNLTSPRQSNSMLNGSFNQKSDEKHKLYQDSSLERRDPNENSRQNLETLKNPSVIDFPVSSDTYEKKLINQMLKPYPTDVELVATQMIHSDGTLQSPVIETINPSTKHVSVGGSRTDTKTEATKKGGVEKKRKDHPIEEGYSYGYDSKIVLSKAKFEQMIQSRSKRAKARRKNADDHVVTCECSYNKLDGDMLCCENCNCWQHVNCYGFISVKDPRIPVNHFCYKCLLGKNEKDLLPQLQTLAILRKSLRQLLNVSEFPATLEIFSQQLGCDIKEASNIISHLEKDGLAVSKFYDKQSGLIKNPCNSVDSNDRSLLEKEYFDPLKLISHHVGVVKSRGFHTLELIELY
ncbi:HORMA domain-containing protein [Geopyxis carbonaria]|nr:HORMA domain-containing protein [Geopyxis carbonaria]